MNPGVLPARFNALTMSVLCSYGTVESSRPWISSSGTVIRSARFNGEMASSFFP
jgi:hypothetical protein